MSKTAVVSRISDMVLESKRIVVFTGVGISTESGIPDFRSPGGIWDRFDPNEFTFQKFLASEASREKFWDFYRLLWATLARAKPNRGHYAIAELDKLGKLTCVITQNVDNLHQMSGIPDQKVIELHGTLQWVICLECGKRTRKEEIQHRLDLGERVPKCECGGIIKPVTVTFGQPMPEREVQEARKQAAGCDLLMICGSSLLVHPAAQIPLVAKDSGAKLVIINLTPTPHDAFSDVVVNENIGTTLSRVVRRVKAKLEK